MKKGQYIYQNGNHKWAVLARDPEKPNFLIDTNEYLIINRDKFLLTDPGGSEIFPAVFSALSQLVDPENMDAIFASHQDPDIISSLSLWLEFKPKTQCYTSWLWSTFIPHFGGSDKTLVSIPDEGMDIDVNGLVLRAIPAHFLHSAGNFHLYDAKAKILFSGDIGAALLPPEHNGLFVENFDQHILAAEGFHRRWMGSNSAKKRWCERVSQLDIDMLCPQHGAIYRGDDVKRFIDWFSALEVGITKE